LLVLFFFLFFCRGNVKAAQIECYRWPGTGNLYEPCCELQDNTGYFGGKYTSGKCNDGLKCNLVFYGASRPIKEGYCYKAKDVCGETNGSECCDWNPDRTGNCKSPDLKCNVFSGECELQTETCHCGKPDKTGTCLNVYNGPNPPCSGDRQAFCKYNNLGDCGWDSKEANCECKTQAEASDDPELNGMSKFIHWSGRDKVFCPDLGRLEDLRVSTALGCVPINFIKFVAWIFDNGFGIVGGIAFLLLIGAFIQLATSEGDVKKIQGVKETITSIVTGLLLAIFSIFIIRMLMITILRIPGLQ